MLKHVLTSETTFKDFKSGYIVVLVNFVLRDSVQLGDR